MMRPIRINLIATSQEKFCDFILEFFPDITDVDWIIQFYEELSEKYLQIVLDLESGEVLQAFQPDGTWVMTKYYLDLVPTPETLDLFVDDIKSEIETNNEDYMSDFDDENFSNLLPQYIEDKNESEIDNQQYEIPFNELEKHIDLILDKIHSQGYDSLSKAEKKILDQYSK